jgi:endonuclease YncB( thermonuclease family)
MFRLRSIIVVLFCVFLPVIFLSACRSRADGRVAEKYPHYADMVEKLSKSRLKVGDGDTFIVGKLRIRILGIDTPEVANPGYGFLEDQPFGRQAGAKAREIISRAEVIEYLPFRKDSYGRMLAHVFVDGQLYGVKMIEAGLAYETVSFYGDNGFPDLAEEILQTADRVGRPSFREPRLWRREHRAK